MRLADWAADSATRSFAHSGEFLAALATPSQILRPLSLSLFPTRLGISLLLSKILESLHFCIEILCDESLSIDVSERHNSCTQSYGFCSDFATFLLSP